MSYRNIQINGRQWQFKIGKSHAHIRSPEGKGETVKLSALSQDYKDRSTVDPIDFYVSNPRKFEVKPSDIRRWIERVQVLSSA